jgi:uncharacterized repeat protein (TIGR01451 family)
MKRSTSLRALLALIVVVVLASCSRQDEPTSGAIGKQHSAVITSFAVGSLVIPMDTTYQDNGTLKAFGLVYKLLSNNVPVNWAILTGKAAGAADFTASGKDVQTGATITSHPYRGGPFIIDSADRTAALPIITAWQATNVTVVHDMTAAFSADVRRTLVAAPRIAVFVDGNEIIAFTYLNAAGIPDSTGKAWPVVTATTYPTYPDILTEAQVRGPATGGAADGVLLRTDGTPNWCQLTSMHYATPANTEAVREVRAWLNSGPSTHAFMECNAALAFESDLNGHFLTTNGIADDGVNPTPLTDRVPDSPFAQFDGTVASVFGLVDSIGLAAGSTFRSPDVTLINLSTAPLTQRIMWITGYLDGVTTKGKVSYLAGHQYTTTLPISTNPTTNGTRLFLNSLFESDCALSTGSPVVTLTKSAPAILSGTSLTFTLAYANTGTGVADSAVVTDAVPAGTTFVSATGGGTFAAGTVTWNLGNLKPTASGSVTFTVTVPTNGTYTNSAKLTYKVSLTTKTVNSNTTSTTKECLLDTHCTVAPKLKCKVSSTTCVQCLANSDCSGATPICDTTTNSCRACTSDADCGGTTPACNTSGTFAGTCKQCSATNKTACTGTTPACVLATATCGCNTSSDCPSGTPTCNTATHTCVAGCVIDADCVTAPALKCDTSATPGACVQCLADGDCTSPLVCDTIAGKKCVECTSTKKGACTAGGTGAACLVTDVCGCLADSDCGGVTSGRVCDATSSKCGPGCRGSGGNGCPTGDVCSSTTAAIGTCGPAPTDGGTDAGDAGADTSGDAGADTSVGDSGSDGSDVGDSSVSDAEDAGADVTDATSDDTGTATGFDASGDSTGPGADTANDAAPDNGTLEGGGCGCTLPGGEREDSRAPMLAIAFALLVARRRRSDSSRSTRS